MRQIIAVDSLIESIYYRTQHVENHWVKIEPTHNLREPTLEPLHLGNNREDRIKEAACRNY